MSSSRDLITEYGLKPNKALGQNFLVDEAAIEQIVSLAAEPGLPLLEIGPGLGALTFPLAGTGLPLRAVELDAVLAGILAERLPANAGVINSDFLKTDLAKLREELGEGDLCAVGNLPYYVTSPISMRLMTSSLPIRRMVLMVQREAADRFMAKPGDKNYVPLSVLTATLFEVSKAFELSPASYWPQPDVSSSVLLFESKGAQLPPGFPSFLKCAFAMRRKTLANNLAAMGVGKSEAEAVLRSAGLVPSVRAEALSPSELARAYDAIHSCF